MKGRQKSGQILIEVLIAVAIAAIVLSLSGYFVQSSSEGIKYSRDRLIASQLAQEAFEATKVIAQEDWHNIWYDSDYSVSSSSAYYLTQNSGKWVLTTDDTYKTITLDGRPINRSLVFYNASRDPTTTDIEATYNSDHNDPSIRKVIVTISGDKMKTTTWTFYATRWENDVQLENDWSQYTDSNPNMTTDDNGNLELLPQ